MVAPYPEENVSWVAGDIGLETLVFGSDFPHGEGLAFPTQYADAQLAVFSVVDRKRIMGDNLETLLAPRCAEGRRGSG